MGFDVNELKFTKEHEWIKIEGKVAIVGISEYAAEQLGDVVHVDLPDTNAQSAQGQFAQGAAFGTLESVKSVSDVYLPVSGKILQVNPGLKDEPGMINRDTYGDGWLVKIEIKDVAELSALLDHNGYQNFLSAEA